MAKDCPRDIGGFCRIAMVGHPLCPAANGECRVTDATVAWEEARERSMRRDFRAWRRRQRERLAR